MNPADGQAQRQYVTCEGYMQNVGTSVPPTGRHGWGRKFLDGKDHLAAAARGDVTWDVDAGTPQTAAVHGRKLLGPPNQLNLVHRTVEVTAVTSAELKADARAFLANAFRVIVSDERKWSEVTLEQHGCEWVARAVSSEGRSLAREGKSARALAEKLSMTPITELRHFGLRFAPSTCEEVPRPAACSYNKSLESPGIHCLLGSRETGSSRPSSPAVREMSPEGCSSARRDPEAFGFQRRYISSGKDNFEGSEIRDAGVQPHGRRYIATRCHIRGGTAAQLEPGNGKRGIL